MQFEEEADADVQSPPPSPARVVRRALALTAVAARAMLEGDAPHLENADHHRQRLLRWIDDLGIGDELEPDEWKVLQRPVGNLDQRSHINAMWRVEGLAVLAWALQLHELPPDDRLIVPADLYQSMGIFDAERGREILDAPRLRSPEALSAMQIHLLMLHWRLRDFSLQPMAMDFVAFSQNCWIGSFDISTFRLLEGDLAIGDSPIAQAPEDAVSMATSIAMERHLAINWLAGYSEVYSDTDTST